MPTYNSRTIIINDDEFYRFLRDKRGVKKIVQYDITPLYNPSAQVRRGLPSTNHIWRYGDRYYKLAQQYYKDPRYWWVIAWYNARPTEADVKPGDVLYIPLDLDGTLKALGAY
tara:strand:- start:7860 stop:8198 length:339 start_codon:yes stop_codon:yes gene_type:complete